MKKITFLDVGVASLGITTIIGSGGVFAADSNVEQTDNVVVTVESSCSLATSGLSPTSTYTRNITNGGYDTNITGSTFTVTCNDTDGWSLTAVGYTNDIENTTYMETDTGDTSDRIATGTTLDGTVSDWAAKFTAGGTDLPTIATGYTNFSDIPDSRTIIATGVSTAGNATVTATYGVGISPTQSAGTYTGKVLYTLVHPNTDSTQDNSGDPANNNGDNSGNSGDNSGDSGNSGDNSGTGGTGGDANSGTGGNNGGTGSGDANSGNGGGDTGNSGTQSAQPAATTNSVTNNHISNNYAAPMTTNSTTNNTYNGSGYSGGGNDMFADVDVPNTDNEEDKNDSGEINGSFEAPLGVNTSSNDDSSNGGMETGFLVALGAAGVAGIATYALIRKQDSE